MPNNYWRTPRPIFDPLNEEFKFTLDAAADDENHLLPRYYTQAQNSLIQSWAGEVVWCNPPYGRDERNQTLIAPFVWKAICASNFHGATVVMLVPASTASRWFHLVWDRVNHRPRTNRQVRFMKGRIAFVDPATGLPAPGTDFDSMLLVFWPRKHVRVKAI
jgi:phage N-6-adenine-methyltransferase